MRRDTRDRRAGGHGAPAAGGFTLLEVMIAIAMLALALAAIGSADNTAILHGSRYHGQTTAALLMRGVVMDIEAEYQEEGFPTNSLEGRRCEVPREFARQFECEYDLIAIEFDPGELQTMVQQGVEGMMGGGEGAGPGGDEGDKGRKGKKGEPGAEGSGLDIGAPDLTNLTSLPGMSGLAGVDTSGFDPTQLLFLAPLLGPEGAAILDICQINIEAMIQKFMGMSAFFPMIVQEAANQTRKLRVKLSWKYGPKTHRELVVTTFIVGLPEEEMRKLREMENLQDANEEMMNLMSPDGGVPGARGGAGGGGSKGAGRGGGGGGK